MVNNFVFSEEIAFNFDQSFFLYVAYQRGTPIVYVALHFFFFKKKNIWLKVIVCNFYSLIDTQLTFICSKSTSETLEKDVEYTYNNKKSERRQ